MCPPSLIEITTYRPFKPVADSGLSKRQFFAATIIVWRRRIVSRKRRETIPKTPSNSAWIIFTGQRSTANAVRNQMPRSERVTL
jgi:hypothetical protein